jgi:Domain of unknown function (DUF222)
VSSLRSALDELRSDELRFLSDEEVAGRLDELEHAARLIDAERARSLAEFDRRGSWAVDGRLSLTAWLADRQLISHAAAGAHVRLARALEHMPRTWEALAAGTISRSAAGLLASARETAPDAFARSEEQLVEAAASLSVSALKRAVELWRQAADAERAAEEEDLRFERRGLHASPALDAMVRVDGDLDPECGQHLLTALRAAMDADIGSGPDARTPAQRRADALGAICRAFLDRSDRPVVGGERPHVVVLVDVETLERRTPGRSELVDAGPITPGAARRLACDADVSRVITGPGSVPLDLGRRTKVVPAPLRRAVVVRDRHCRFPGCDRPPSWCDAHHVHHWADGGPTCLANLVLLCRRHHRLIHRAFRVEMVEGARPVFRRPDGTLLEDRAPP